ncbi:hypothetical protein Hanom_Chr02g00113821 [Helianthus anomalus]
MAQQMAINNAHVLHYQELHQRDFETGQDFQQFTMWTRYEDLPIPTGPPQPAPGWPQGLASSFLPLQLQQPAEWEQGPLDDFHEMILALTGYPTSHTL